MTITLKPSLLLSRVEIIIVIDPKKMAPMIKGQIARLKKPADGKQGASVGSGDADEESAEAGSEKLTTEQRFDKLEHLLQEMSERLKSMEKRLPPPKQ